MSKYMGTGTPDTSRHEWGSHMARDTAAVVASSDDWLQYLSVATGHSVERLRVQQLDSMLAPCGPPPPPSDYNFLLRDFMPKKRRGDYDGDDEEH